MKKSIAILLTFVPMLAGYLINLSIFVPGVGIFLYYVLPIAVCVFWFWLGGRYASINWGVAPALLIGNATGLLSLALYLWQFLGRSSETRNMTLATLSQLYSGAAPGYLYAGLALKFEPDPDVIGMTSAVAMQVIGTVLMIVIFTAGYVWGKKRQRR